MRGRKERDLFRQELRQKPTAAENKVRGFLINNGIKHNFQKVRQFFIVDFWIKDYPYIIEVDGEYHESEEQKKYDRRRSEFLEKTYRKKVIRIKNSQALDKDQLVLFFKDLFS